MYKCLIRSLVIFAISSIIIGCNGDNSSGQPAATNTAARTPTGREVVVYTPGGGRFIYSMVKGRMAASGLTYDVKIMEGVTTDLTIKGLKDGMFDMIFLHHPPEPEEGIEFFELARVNVAIFTYPDISFDSLTTGQIAAIFSGEITNWSDVGGRNQDIAVFRLPEFDSTTEALQDLALGEKPFVESAQMFPDETSALLSATGVPGGIAYATWATKKYLELADPAVNDQKFHVISIDGTAIDDPAYPMSIVLGFGYLPEQAESLSPLFDWLTKFMESTQGEALLQLFDVGTAVEW